MTVVNFYAPTNEKSVDNDKAKDTFYKDLYNLLSNIPPHNVLIVLGDFNARIGKDSHQSYPTVTGPFCSEEQTNENGQRLVDLCIENNLRPVSTRFPHKLGRLWTWTHSSGTHSQIDHILITSKWVNSVRNCRAYNTIQEIDSDHRIVVANFKLSLRTTKRPPKMRQKYNWNILKDDICIQGKFDIELKNKFQLLEEQYNKQHDDLEGFPIMKLQLRNDALLQAVVETSELILGKKKVKTTDMGVRTYKKPKRNMQQSEIRVKEASIKQNTT